MFVIQWIYILLITSTSSSTFAQLLLTKRDLTVKAGRSAYLRRDDLVFARRQPGEECRVEVVQNEPITQRVGTLEPKIFDCSFLSNTIKYIHNGSPLLSEDTVKLRVYKFTDSSTETETFQLNVRIVNASHDIVVTRGLRSVIVPEFNGISNTIDASVIRFYSSDNQNASCTVGFSNRKSEWPIAGHIVSFSGQTKLKQNAVKSDCREFLYMNLHYEHVSAPSPDVDYLPLHIELYDPSLSDEVIEENFYLPIHIKGALPNSPPMSSHMNMYMMDVDQFVLSTIIPGVIKAVDSETPNAQLVYNISQPLRQGGGYFVNLDDHTVPISSFLQDDLQNHRIAYQPPNVSHLERKVYECKFVVFDSHFANSLEILLHISVRPSATTAPRVSYLKGLVLLEGQSRAITNRNIQIVDRDNIDRVRIYVRGGLQYGRLEINGRRTMSFSPRDLESETVIYYHDDSDTLNDQIDIRISDGVNTVLANFPITIIPKDDSPPYVVNNLGLEVNEGEISRIRSQMLMATDTDSVDKNIVYNIVQPPGAGEIIRRIRPTDVGTRVNKFVQRDIIKGQIFYRHFGHEVFTDSFTFKLKDNQDPPNKSGLETFHIRINPVNENPPQLSPEATRLMHVLESDIAYITTAELQYTDVETDDNQLTYTITSPPYFVYSNGREDAGRIIATHNVSMVMKDPSLAPIRTFKQQDINHMKIAYMPPMNDIGPQARLVRFVYTVQDSNRNKVLGQYFDIDVQPVNNQAPSFVASKLLVEEGGILGISTNQLSATDADTVPDELTFILDEAPLYGVIQKGGNSLAEDGTFTLSDLQSADIRYVHGGSDIELDAFTLTVTDGVNRATKVFSVDIIPTDDRAPQLRDNLRSRLIVSEGGEAVVTSSVLAATDDDTDDHQLVFLIVKQPKHGVMQLDGQPATKFTQQEVEDRHVKYIHTGGEIGTVQVKDSVTLIVSDQNYMASADLPVYDLNISITPVDNSKPTIITGREVFVNESGSFTFTPDVVTAKDPDTAPEKISFMIVKQPQWGYLENVKPNPGSEKSNAGIRISSFKLQDIIDNTINYVQSNHRGVEPVYDELQFYATDGRLRSTVETFGIRIIPQNDEEPDIMLKDFVVEEGGSMLIDKSMVDVIDMDMPKDQIRLSISQPPEHGDIVVMLQTKNGDVEAAVQDFSIDELHSGMQLKYRHDDTEHFRDNFALTVSDGRHEVKKMCNITISSMNDERPEVAKNAGLQLEYGDYAMISSMSLQSIDPDNSENEIYYILVSLPRKGSLQYCSNPFSPTRESECEDLSVGMNFTQHDVDMNRIRYIHTTSMGSSETDSFLFLLSDGINKRQVETFEIRIRNSQKANLALLNKGLNVREGERTPLSTANLSASDESTKAEEIVFAIIRPPSLGQIEYINKPLTSISSFTQLDLAARRIVYNHLTKSDITKDSFTFTVTNGLSQAKDGEFVITIDPLDRILPSLKANELIEVVQGGEVQITSSNLRAQDPDTSEINVTYLIAKPPTYGHLLNRDVVITRSFTQHDIDLGYISYESESSHTGLANFLFTINDGRHDGFLVNGTLHTKPIICSIFVKPLVNDAPKLLTVKSPDTLEYFGRDRYGFRLNSRNLKAVDSDTVNNRLMYVMTRRPRHGRIENVATKRYVRRRFSQKDLDDNSLLYIVNQRDQATNDSFTFRLIDGRGNSIDNQRFQMRWSTIEFVKTYIVVCEDIGTLTITLKRTGSLEAMAFVGITVKEMSAKEGRDFIPSTAQQVQFNPGMAEATWDVIIPDDGLQENNEKFRLMLEEPVNAVLGKRRKVNIRIINAEGGECPQYLGMISKNHKEVLDIDEFFLPASENTQTDTIIPFQSFKNSQSQRQNPFDNTYNTDPRQSSDSDDTNADDSDVTENAKSNKSSKSRRRKKGKKSKGRKNKKRRRNGNAKSKKTRKNSASPDTNNASSDESAFSKLQKPALTIQAPQQCTQTTRGLLHFDKFSQRMYKCDGTIWRAWNQDSNEEQTTSPITTCPQDWSEYKGRCYQYVDELKNWEEAEKHCGLTNNGHLSSVQSRKHYNWLLKLTGKNSFWIGLNDRRQAKVWEYTNGEAVTFTRWARGRPRVRRTVHRKNCVLVNKRRKWKNKLCNKTSKRFICEIFLSKSSQNTKPKRHTLRGRRQKNTRGIFNGF